jgi:hypothetical protein
MEFTEADRQLFTLRRWVGPTADRIADLVAASGLDATAFAEAAEVDAKRVARLMDRTRSAPSGFDQVAITPPGDSDHAGLRIEIAGAIIRFGPNDDAALLRMAVEALRC